MSISGLTTSYIPASLDGLNVIDADQIYIDGQLVNLTDYVPYQGANRTIDAGGQNIQTTHTATATNDVVNKGLLDTTISNLAISIAGSFLDKVSVTPQIVIGNVSYTAQLSADDLLVPATKKATLGSVLSIDANWQRSETDAGVITRQYFGSISSSMGIYEATSTQNFAILQCADLGTGTGKRMDITWNLNINETYNSSIQLFASSDGVTTNQYLGPSVSFTPSDPLYKVMTGTFVPQYRYLCVLCATSKPSGVQTVRWYGLDIDEQGIELTNVTMPSLTADRVAVLNGNKQLVSSGISTTTLGYIDHLSSDAQSQLNGKLNLSGGTMTGDIVMGSNKVTSTATPTTDDTLTRKGYVDTQDNLRVLKSGDTMTGSLIMGAFKVTSSATPVIGDDYTNKTYVDTSISGLASTYAKLAGPQTFTGTHTFSSATPINLSGLTASRVLQLDGSKNVQTSAVTTTELGYVVGVTSGIQGQINGKASTSYVDTQDGLRVLKAGDTMTGVIRVSVANTYAQRASNPLPSNFVAESNSQRLYMGAYYTGGSGACATIQSSDFYSSADHGTALLLNPLGGSVGIGTSTPAYQLHVEGTSYLNGITQTGQIQTSVSGASANTTANIKFSNSASHIDNIAGEVYLFTGYNGRIGIQRNTTRNATTACLALGTSDTEESEVVSYKADGSGYMPLSYAGSFHRWIAGNSTDTTVTSYTLLGQTGFDGSNLVNIQCQASQFGRNQLIMTGRYEGANDAWAFASARNAIRFRTQSSLNSAYTNRWTIQNFAGELGFLSATGGDTPRVVLTDGGNVGIGTASPNASLHVFKDTDGGTLSYVSNPSAGLSAYALLAVINNTGNGCVLFQNSNARIADGGVNTATLRNDAGRLRLMSNSGTGLAIESGGFATLGAGDSSMMVYGPNSTWGAYLRCGAGTTALSANTCQVISTNGNLHIDAGFGKDLHLNTYLNASGQLGLIFSYGISWHHQGRMFINGNVGIGSDQNTNRLEVYSTTADYTNSVVIKTPWAGITLDNGQVAFGRKWGFFAGGPGAGIGTGNLGIFDITANRYCFNIEALGNMMLGSGYNAWTKVGVNGGITCNTSGGGWTQGGNAVLITQDGVNQGSQSNGLQIAFSANAGWITCLQPGIAWREFNIYASQYYFYTNGVLNVYLFPGIAGWITASDEREKEDIQDLKTDKSLKRIMALRPKHYRRKYYETETPVSDEIKQMRHVGFLAQEVQQSNPHCVSHFCNKEAKSEEDNGDRLGVNYNDLNIHLVGAVQEIVKQSTLQSEIVQEQQRMINEQTKRIATLEAREVVWLEHAREQEAKMGKMTRDMEKMASLLAQLISKQ